MPKWDIDFQLRVDIDNPSLIRMVERARALSSVIRGIPIPPSAQQRFDKLNIMRAIKGTTGIEGNTLTEDEVSEVMEAPEGKMLFGPERNREVNEVRNAKNLMLLVRDLLEKDPNTPLTEDLIKRFHRTLTSGIAYEKNEPGAYREHAVQAGTYVPPRTRTEIANLMTHFIKWFHEKEPKGWDELVKAVVAHFYVVSIHPFGDGNGRVSRAVESFLLYRANVNARGFYSLANFFYQNRTDYINHLNGARFGPDKTLTPFVLFALKGLVSELTTVHGEVITEVKRVTYRDYIRDAFTSGKHSRSITTERRVSFLSELAWLPDGVPLDEVKGFKHAISRFYSRVTPKTFDRDIAYFLDLDLVLLEKGVLKANLSVLSPFIAP